MRNIYFIVLLVMLGFTSLSAQTVVQFTINQSPVLAVNAGTDKEILFGKSTVLGGSPTASGGTGVYTYLWTPAEGLSQTNIPNPIASPVKTTSYTLVVNDGKKCTTSASTTITVSSILGIEEVNDEIGLLIYPNPNDGTFLVTSEKRVSNGPILIEVFNAIGALVYSEKIPDRAKMNTFITLPNASSGLYLLRLSGSDLKVSKALMIK